MRRREAHQQIICGTPFGEDICFFLYERSYRFYDCQEEMSPEVEAILYHDASSSVHSDIAVIQLIISVCYRIDEVDSIEKLRDPQSMNVWLGVINQILTGGETTDINQRLHSKTIVLAAVIVRFIELQGVTLSRQHWWMFTPSRFRTRYPDIWEEVNNAPNDALQTKAEPMMTISSLRIREIQRLIRLERFFAIVFDPINGLNMSPAGKGEAIFRACRLLLEPDIFRANGGKASRMTQRRLKLFYTVSGVPSTKLKRGKRRDSGKKRFRLDISDIDIPNFEEVMIVPSSGDNEEIECSIEHNTTNATSTTIPMDDMA